MACAVFLSFNDECLNMRSGFWRAWAAAAVAPQKGHFKGRKPEFGRAEKCVRLVAAEITFSVGR